ncbi:MAG TPA: TlpA disulfide reductase family protein [Sporichthyaceae bacterium]|nr:TlpA disulfide reductase family protein [Sporichthyaceae bacterium]
MKLPRDGRALIAAVTLGLLAACGSSSSASVEPTPSADSAVATVNSRPDGPAVPCTDLTTPVSTVAPTAVPTGAGDRLAALSLACLGGGADVNLADLRGPALLNVWASWCGTCAQEVAYLVEAHRALGGTVRFLGLDVADDAADARAWNDFHHVYWPSLADPTSEIRGPLRVPGPPVTFFIRSDGTLAGVHYGAFTSTDEVRAAVEKQLGPIAKGTG